MPRSVGLGGQEGRGGKVGDLLHSWPQAKVVKFLLLLLVPLFILLPMVTFQSRFLESAHGWMFLAFAGSDGRELGPGRVHGSEMLLDLGPQDKRCYSRTQHLLYRRASRQFAPGRELVRAWEKYEERHRRCSHGRSWQDTFRNLSSEDSCKFLYYEEGFGGLGNRLLSLVSAFTYALLTDRVLVMDAHSNLARLLCEPFKGSSWLLPDDFPYWEMLPMPHLGDAVQQDFKNISRLYVELLHEQSWGDQQFFCQKTQEELQKVAWISWRSNQYYVPRLFTMAGYWEALTPLFPNASLAFTHISRHIMLPQNPIWDRILRVYWSYLAFASQQVGVQVRRHSAPPDFDPAAHARVVECLTGHGILPNVTSFREGESNLQGLSLSLHSARAIPQPDQSAIAKSLGEEVTSLGPTVVLVASLQIGYSQELKKVYTNTRTADGSLVRVHQVTQDGTEWASYEQAVDAFTEMWLLSFSDRLATSSWSTFGYIAQGLGGLHPSIMNIKGNFQQDGLPACVTGQSVEPCNHFPFYDVECGSDSRSLEHLEWIKRHVRHCQDEIQGIQLVQ